MKPRPHRALHRTAPLTFAAVLMLAGLAGCQRPTTGGTVSVPTQPSAGPQEIVGLPLGAEAGAGPSRLGATITNPYAGEPQAIQHGKDLFIKMNCAGCHGYGAVGGMGPSLTDTYWRYGSTPVQIFKSIYEGRPHGMPAWNPALPQQDIWRIVAYIDSLGGAAKPEGYQAWFEGDRPGENVAPGVKSSLPASAKPPPAKASATKKGGPPGNQSP